MQKILIEIIDQGQRLLINIARLFAAGVRLGVTELVWPHHVLFRDGQFVLSGVQVEKKHIPFMVFF